MTTNEASAGRLQPDERARLADMMAGYQRTQLLYVAAKLGLADLLASGPRSVDELALASSTHSRSLGRFLRALTGQGIFRLREDGRFEMTPLAEPLLKDAPRSIRGTVLSQGEENYRAWGDLLYAIQTGQTGFEHAFGLPAPDYREQHPEANERFNRFMSEGARRRVDAFLEGYPLPQEGVVVDVGGGDGTLIVGILKRYPHLRGVLFDLPRAVADFQVQATDPDVVSRLRTEGGSFFDAVPSSGDIYILSLILHNWDDGPASEILQRCYQAMPPGARLLLLDQVVPDGMPPATLSDLNMLVMCGGYERTESDWRSLLKAGPFEISQILTSPSIIEAVPL